VEALVRVVLLMEQKIVGSNPIVVVLFILLISLQHLS